MFVLIKKLLYYLLVVVLYHREPDLDGMGSVPLCDLSHGADGVEAMTRRSEAVSKVAHKAQRLVAMTLVRGRDERRK